MGGEDWARGSTPSTAATCCAPGSTTVALSYIGSHLTSAIYRQGTIGAAKSTWRKPPATLDDGSAAVGGRALTSVNGAAVTQASTAIPGIALYLSLLHAVLGDGMRSPLEQSVDLWDQLTGVAPLELDEEGRLRLDGWELDPAVQAAVPNAGSRPPRTTIAELADLALVPRRGARGLYGFDVPGVDYTQPCEPDLPWPTAVGSAIIVAPRVP